MSVKKLGKLTEAKPANTVSVHPEEMRYRAEEALRTIHRAEEFKRNKPLLREVKKLAKAHAKACGVK